ncbi:MAG: hypothetical protein RIS76_925 [Verrucomicrobiota bacterium]|jgi:uncharacterized SAM-dependent methyltransferase
MEGSLTLRKAPDQWLGDCPPSSAPTTDPANAWVSVGIHPSQFPGAIAASLRESLRTREMNHKFHYDTPRQALRWLRLHEAFSPARTDPNCHQIYHQAFAAAAARLREATEIQVISLGCGGGQKDAQLLEVLRQDLPGRRLHYVPADVSPSLTLVSRDAAMATGLTAEDCVPLVLDLGATADWRAALEPALRPSAQRVICFFGMLPNFAPSTALTRLAALVRPDDLLLFSANLAPGADYAAGVERIRPLYDNALTREWLWTVLQDLGAEAGDGGMTFRVAPCPEGSGLLRIEAVVTFARPCRLQVEGEFFDYATGTEFRLFYSYRHTPERLRILCDANGLTLTGQWENGSGEEGVFLGSRRP